MLDLKKVKVVGLRKAERGEFYFLHGNLFEAGAATSSEYAIVAPLEGFRFVAAAGKDGYEVVPVTRKYTLIKVPGHFNTGWEACEAAYFHPMSLLAVTQIEE